MLLKEGGTVKDVDPEGRTVTGYFSTFDKLDSQGDIIRQGAFARTISQRGPDGANRIWHLDQHRVTRRIAKPRVLREDERGLYFETVVPPTTLGDDLLVLYQEGHITEHSVGIDIIQASPTEIETEADGTVEAREITEARAWEGSTVTWGANADTPTEGVKAVDKPEAAEKHISRIRSVLKEGVSDETAELLEIEMELYEAQVEKIEAEEEAKEALSGENINWREVEATIETLQNAKERADALGITEDPSEKDTPGDDDPQDEATELLSDFNERLQRITN